MKEDALHKLTVGCVIGFSFFCAIVFCPGRRIRAGLLAFFNLCLLAGMWGFLELTIPDQWLFVCCEIYAFGVIETYMERPTLPTLKWFVVTAGLCFVQMILNPNPFSVAGGFMFSVYAAYSVPLPTDLILYVYKTMHRKPVQPFHLSFFPRSVNFLKT